MDYLQERDNNLHFRIFCGQLVANPITDIENKKGQTRYGSYGLYSMFEGAVSEGATSAEATNIVAA